MTTKVTIAASGQSYPARVHVVRRPCEGERQILLDKLVANGESIDVWCGDRDIITVTEEYHPLGYPKPNAGQPKPEFDPGDEEMAGN